MSRTGARTWPVQVLAGVVALGWALPFFGLIDLMVVVTQDERFAGHYLMESGWGLLYLVLVAVPFLAVAVRPAAPEPLLQVLVVALAVVVAAALASYPPQLWVALGLAVSVLVVGAAAGLRALPDLRADPAVVAAAVCAVPSGVGYAWSMAHGWTRLDRLLDPDVTNGLEHRPMQGALGLAVPLVACLAALAVGGRWSRWRVPVWTVAITVLWLGVESVVYPDREGSLGTTAGIGAAAWAVLFVTVAEVRARSRRWR